MKIPFDLNQIIQESGCLWGQAELQTILSKEQRTELMNRELVDWLSALYWSEGIAAEYALRMESLLATNKKALWQRIYRDEIDHHIRVGRWLLDKSIAPHPPNDAVRFAKRNVELISKDSPPDVLKSAIENSQLFFEEYTTRLLHWRLPHVVDRDLKSLLYRIKIDEKHHIPAGHSAMTALGFPAVNPDSILRENLNLLFPIHLAKKTLSADQFSSVRLALAPIFERVFFDGRSALPNYSPIAAIAQFEDLPGYDCVACSPWHEAGLHLEPKLSDDKTFVWDNLLFASHTQGFNNIVHGGFISMALDEMLGWAVILQNERMPLTKNLEVTFLAPIKTGKTYRIETKVTSSEEGEHRAEGAIVDCETGKPHATAKGLFFVPTAQLAGRIFPDFVKHERIGRMFRQK